MRRFQSALRGLDSLADDLVIQRRALLVALVVHRPVGVDAEASCLLGCVDVGAQEQEFPAVFFLLTLDHAPHPLVIVAAAGIFVAVGGDDEHGLFRHVLPAGVLVDVADVVDGAAHGVQQRRAATGEVLLLPVRGGTSQSGRRSWMTVLSLSKSTVETSASPASFF